MIRSAKWFGVAALAGLALAGPLALPAQAQRIIMPVPFNNAVPPNPNIYLNPYTGLNLRQAAFNTAVLGQALSTIPPYAMGFNPYPQVSIGGNPLLATGLGGIGGGNPYLGAGLPLGGGNPYLSTGGYGGGAGSPVLSTSGGYGGSGSFAAYSSDPYGAGGGGGYTNPYNGYLSGAASVTSANGQYQIQIQSARLMREQSRQAAIETRRKLYDEAMYEQMHRPDPEKIRQHDQEVALDRARHTPPLTEVWSGTALNDLYNHLSSQYGQLNKGPKVPLDEDMLKGINLTPRDTRANPGLLKDEGKLQWPLSLMSNEFTEPRRALERLLADAVQQVKFNNPVPAGSLRDMHVQLGQLNDTLRDRVNDLSPTQFIEAQRYLHQVGDAVKALEDPKVGNYVNRNWTAKGKNVAELSST